MPSFTIISCALAAIYNGAVPVLVDSDPNTWCMNVDQIEGKITSRTRAIMAVHIYGHPVVWIPLLELAKKYGLQVIEDAAEAHGAEYLSGHDNANQSWQRCGSFGALSTFSFYANKLITTGEGGMIVTDDPHLTERARSLRNLCFQPGRRFYHEELGFNFRLTNLQAALGFAQLKEWQRSSLTSVGWVRSTLAGWETSRAYNFQSRNPGLAVSIGCMASCWQRIIILMQISWSQS